MALKMPNSYTSPDIHNWQSLPDLVQEKILLKYLFSWSFFTALWQAIVIWYVHAETKSKRYIHEKILTYVEVDAETTLSTYLLDALYKLKLDPKNIVSQEYNGASIVLQGFRFSQHVFCIAWPSQCSQQLFFKVVHVLTAVLVHCYSLSSSCCTLLDAGHFHLFTIALHSPKCRHLSWNGIRFSLPCE